MKVTFKDVARLAGVSTQTVSRVTHNARNVSEKTRQRVQDAIRQLGYIPSKSAQLLGRNQSRTIGLVTLDLIHYGAAMQAAGIRRAAREKGYGLLLGVAEETTVESIHEALKDLMAQQIDAVIINIAITSEHAVSLTQQYPDLPIVFSDTEPAPELVTVMSDHCRGAAMAAQHLLANSRRRIFFVHGPLDSAAARLRREGWLQALAREGLKPVGECVANWSGGQAFRLTSQMLQKRDDGTVEVDGILCASDQMALGVLKALNTNNVNIPGEIAVSGFDDTPDSALYQPALTTIRQDFFRLGKLIVESLLALLNEQSNGNTPELITRMALTKNVEVSLVVRESTE
ncbi:LacI family DNA-binding transcriptional regulator [Endozoicomonas euniceicola]|uniref:LacI family DNA-binding transcriptional regulator n=1 Tax=Endozoicomonas euniceicola TaxID=1234143 RepID=A0ABY6GTD8_9GAMM|nr:LacI family DNA-binding transcriptional regulator [Endozoicomonas euniceicola]UYM16038.1 LacI family DNA-binding transcriptional regulator [Endozoicomonas euniceicola]